MFKDWGIEKKLFTIALKYESLPRRADKMEFYIHNDETCLRYRRAFFNLSIVDTNFRTCLSDEEWARAEKIATFFKPFFNITALFSGSLYPTSNLYFHNVGRIQLPILKEMEDDDEVIKAMAMAVVGGRRWW